MNYLINTTNDSFSKITQHLLVEDLIEVAEENIISKGMRILELQIIEPIKYRAKRGTSKTLEILGGNS